jgi:hypothetical protein
MTSLIETTSPLYVKRLARELNGLEHGFYASNGLRFSQARVRNGSLELRMPVEGNWIASPDMSFCDTYGRSIVASRRA